MNYNVLSRMKAFYFSQNIHLVSRLTLVTRWAFDC